MRFKWCTSMLILQIVKITLWFVTNDTQNDVLTLMRDSSALVQHTVSVEEALRKSRPNDGLLLLANNASVPCLSELLIAASRGLRVFLEFPFSLLDADAQRHS